MNTCPYGSFHKSLTSAQIKKILDQDCIRREHAVIKLMLLTGMRPSETLGLCIKDVDTERRIIHVCRQQYYDRRSKSWKLKPVTKNFRSRWIPIGEEAASLIRTEISRRNAETGNKGDVNEQQLFRGPEDMVITPSQLRKAFSELMVGVECSNEARLYDLRHTAATAGHRATGDIRGVQKMLGHVSPDITERYYLDGDDTRKKNMAYKIDEYYKNMIFV